jgi:thiamine-monophosphate kinase
MPARALQSEDDFLRLLDRTFGRARAGRGVALGRGDDGALLTSAGWCVTVDALVENVHFRRDSITAKELGRKAFAVNASDLNAMGTKAAVGFLSLTLPKWVTRKYLLALLQGMAGDFKKHNVILAGGNLSAGGELQIHLTLMGKSPAAPLRRDRAKAGDSLVVIGNLGLARAGLSLQEMKRRSPGISLQGCKSLLAAQNTPAPPLEIGPRLSAFVARSKFRIAALDLSDGLARDALRFSDHGKMLGAELDMNQLPIAPLLRKAAQLLKMDPRQLTLQGGEDYALLIACPEKLIPALKRRAVGHLVCDIGRLTRRPGLRLANASGRRSASGFDHFRS